jgi:KRAB domain-containing zinc finger protein
VETAPAQEKTEESKNKSSVNDNSVEDNFDSDDGDDDIEDAERFTEPTSAKVNATTYTCSHCGKILSSKGNLKKHEVIHSDVKPWQCKECGANYNRARDLKTHQMQKHSGERPHIGKASSSRTKCLSPKCE